jgi:hypothetical protein
MEVVLLRKQSNLLLLWPMVCDASTHREIHRRNEAVPEGDTFFKFVKQTELFFYLYCYTRNWDTIDWLFG